MSTPSTTAGRALTRQDPQSTGFVLLIEQQARAAALAEVRAAVDREWPITVIPNTLEGAPPPDSVHRVVPHIPGDEVRAILTALALQAQP